MKIRKIITPNFYKKFRCVGPECLNHCCHGWVINIDKKNHNKYINSSDEEIRSIAKEALRLTRKGKKSYSMIKFNDEGTCPFFTADKLCRVHQKLGSDALSPTCAIYPRGDAANLLI